MPDVSARCRGWPEGHVCPVWVEGSIWCTGCRTRRQEAIALGVSDTMTPVGIIIEDFDAPRLQCACSGDPESPHHVDSLLHLVWSNQIRQAEAAKKAAASNTE